MRLLLFICMACAFLNAASFQAYTESMPPYNYVENREVKGSSTHILQELFQVSGHNLKEKILVEPWANAYQKVIITPNTLLYSTARTPQRENKFAWVGPIDTMQVGVLAKKNSGVKITDKDDLNKYTIATLPTSMAEGELLKQGVFVENLDRFSLISSQLKKLRDDRVDAVAFSIPGMLHIMPKLGMNPQDYEMVYLLKEIDLYFAFNMSADAGLIKELNQILQDLNALHRHSKTLR